MDFPAIPYFCSAKNMQSSGNLVTVSILQQAINIEGPGEKFSQTSSLSPGLVINPDRDSNFDPSSPHEG